MPSVLSLLHVFHASVTSEINFSTSALIMLERISIWLLRLKFIALVLLSLLFLPLTTPVLVLTYALRAFSSVDTSRRRTRRSFVFQPKTVLITGIGTAKGLFLARSFYKAGHDVIGADFEPNSISISGRFSRSLQKFYSLAQPGAEDNFNIYLPGLLGIIRKEKVDLWINCSGQSSAVEDAQAKEIIERRSDCVVIQFGVALTNALHKRLDFIQRTRELGLPVPETHEVMSRTAVHKILHSPAASKKKYVMKRFGGEDDDGFQPSKTLLPRRTTSETYNHISIIPISSSSPWILQEYIPGQKYSTHALVINNVVKAFVACPSTENQMCYEALPRSALSLAMQRFTQEFARRSPSGMTGHLSFEFQVQETVSEKGLEVTLRAATCNPRAHTSMMLLSKHSQALAEAYLSALRPWDPKINGNHVEKRILPDNDNESTNTPDSEDEGQTPHEIPDSSNIIITIPDHPSSPKFYWLGHDIITLLILPLFNRPFSISISTYAHNIIIFLQHLLFWNDAMFAAWDPLPWWWFYHVYWPGIILVSMWTGPGKKWGWVDFGIGESF